MGIGGLLPLFASCPCEGSKAKEKMRERERERTDLNQEHRNGNLKTVGGTVMNKAAKDVANGILSKKYKPIRVLIRHSVHLNEQQT